MYGATLVLDDAEELPLICGQQSVVLEKRTVPYPCPFLLVIGGKDAPFAMP